MKNYRNAFIYRFFILSFSILLSVATHSAYAGKKTIGILVYDGVLSSDVTAPAEVFGAATRQVWLTDYDVKMISVNDQPFITTEEGLSIKTDTHIGAQQQLTALIVPSAYNMQPLLNNQRLIEFIQTHHQQAEWLVSHCSGAELLAEAGLLAGKKATTWAGGEDDFQKKYPSVLVQHDQHYVVADNIITGNGSAVSYLSAIKLLSFIGSEKLANEVFESLQLHRIVSSY